MEFWFVARRALHLLTSVDTRSITCANLESLMGGHMPRSSFTGYGLNKPNMLQAIVKKGQGWKGIEGCGRRA